MGNRELAVGLIEGKEEDMAELDKKILYHMNAARSATSETARMYHTGKALDHQKYLDYLRKQKSEDASGMAYSYDQLECMLQEEEIYRDKNKMQELFDYAVRMMNKASSHVDKVKWFNLADKYRKALAVLGVAVSLVMQETAGW